jgi:transposase InsO family protein
MNNRASHSALKMAMTLNVSRSGYYAWLTRPPSVRELNNKVLVSQIRKVHQESRLTYGSPRISVELKATGISCSRNRVERLMHQYGIAAKSKRKYKRTTRSRIRQLPTPDLLKRNFSMPAKDSAWVADITYIYTREGWLYLATVLDLYSRKIVGWSMSDRLKKELALKAFKQAVEQRHPREGLIFHSDRGSQYASDEFRKLLSGMACRQSMSGSGSCYDNAVAESFFATLKTELMKGVVFEDRKQARLAIFDYIEVFYNRKRRHSTLGYKSPLEFETLTINT